MAFTKEISSAFHGALNKPLGGSKKIPALLSQLAMSAVPRGRGAYVPATQIVYVPAVGTANLMRFDIVNRVELAPLAVVGATSLRACVYSSLADRLYCIDITGGNNTIRKINYNDGTSVSLAPVNVVFNDLLFLNPLVFTTGNGNVQKLTNADVFTQFTDTFAPFSATPRGMDSNGGNVLAIAGQGADAPGNIGTVTINTRVLNGGIGDYCMSFGPTSLQALVGRGDASAANAIRAFNMSLAAPALSNIPPNTTGQFLSGGYSPTFLMHFFFDQNGSQIFILDDTVAGFPIIKKQAVNANTTLEPNDCFPVDTGRSVFMPSASSKIMNIFG